MGIDINAAITELQEKRKVFCSEADFQLELAWILKEQNPNYQVRLEYVPSFNKKMHIDIVLMNKNEFIPIELKYKTKYCDVDFEDEQYSLANQGAQDIGRYLYLKDIERIEWLRDNEPLFNEGYAIFLTNDGIYKQCKEGEMYSQFSLIDNTIKSGIMQWNNNPRVGESIKNPISFKSSYIMKWEDYSNIKTEQKNANGFYILTTKIEKQ